MENSRTPPSPSPSDPDTAGEELRVGEELRSDRREKPRPYRPRKKTRRERLVSRLRELEPGLITGAADDDPSGIATYSQAGAAFGYGLLWTALVSLPLMSAIQLMCARIGIVARSGVAAVMREHYPKWTLGLACSLLVIGNTINIAADLAGMAGGARLLTGISAVWFVPAFTLLILALLIFASYDRMTRVLKWLTLALFSYVFAAMLSGADWAAVVRGTVVPNVIFSRDYLLTFVAIMGTTISPYLFFWQAAQNAEQDAHIMRRIVGRPRRAVQRELRAAARDVNAGMLFSNLIMYFIILTAGATLHRAGITNVQTAEQAATALRPIAGNAAALLFTIGLVGTGMLGVPVLAGSAAYAIAEAAAWRAGMDERVHNARQFYGVIAVAMIVGMMLNFAHVNAIKLLIGSAVINGLLPPPVIAIAIVVCNNDQMLGTHPNLRSFDNLSGRRRRTNTNTVRALVSSWMFGVM